MDSQTRARARWTDAAFVAANEASVRLIVSGRAHLDGVDLAGVAIGCEGPVPDLATANLYLARIHSSDFSFASLSGSLNETELVRVQFRHAVFDQCLMKQSKLSECDFSNAKLVASLDDSVFENC